MNGDWGPLVGHEAAREAFAKARGAGRMPHAWLLTGPKGVGKALFARLAAARLLGRPGEAPEAVRERVREGRETRLRLLERPLDEKTDKRKSVIPVDLVRALKADLALSAPDGAWRVALIDAAEDLNPAAANALLKLLEEPPPRVVFLLVSHAPGKLLPTIRSRCRRLEFQELSAAGIAGILAARGESPAPEEAAALAALAEGSAGAALALKASGGLELYARLVELLRFAPRPADRSALEALAARAPEDSVAPEELWALLLARLARAAAYGAPLRPEAAAGESALAARIAPPAAGALWAEAQARQVARAAEAKLLNLDRGLMLLDAARDFEETAARAARLHAPG
ncbi:DNA polymerase III subunit delta' [Neomegalonema sp.]|uniref:DNA polymerase III subunit delta' n=1 Tax=Neomegalonema sp. TaxID=2039713 RepID=UPI0026252618|nr:DNA polymerase III subunit delta' [Neomegalonema sp.]MDD2869391.1 DNA polymerase III subunit delta' [Neomegalonema sp.]